MMLIITGVIIVEKSMMSSTNYQYPLNKVDSAESFRVLIKMGAKKYGNRPAFVYQNHEEDELTTITYNQWLTEVMTASAGLAKELNLNPSRREGKKIALIAPNSYNWVLAYFAALNLNQVIVPLDWQLPARDLLNALQKANVSAIIYAPEVSEKMQAVKMANVKIRHFISWEENAMASCTWPKLMANGESELKKEIDFEQKWPVYPESLSVIMFTSGTTSSPKGVMLTQANLMANATGIAQLLDLKEEVLLSILPLFHAYEFTAGALTQLLCGSTIYYLAGGLHRFSQNLQLAKPTLLFLVPLIVEGCYTRIVQALPNDLDQKLINQVTKKYFGGKLRKILVGGAPLNPEVADRFEEMKTVIIQGYGASENSPVIATGRDRANKHKSVGFPLPNSKVKIAEKNEDGVGEIMVRGPSVMMGYYGDEKKTNEAIKDGWLCTGDYGYFDEDGFLYVTGRKKNVIIGKNAKNVYPEEIEQLLNETSGIKESLVYGKLVNDDVEVAALIVPEENLAEKLEKPLIEEKEDGNKIAMETKAIKSFLKKKIKEINANNPRYKEIKEWQIVSGLPRTTSGKIKRGQNVDEK